MRSVVALGGILMIAAVPAAATEVVLVEADFEAPYTTGPLAGQQGWTTLSNPSTFLSQWRVDAVRPYAGQRSATFDTRLVGGSHWAWRTFDFVPDAEFELLEAACWIQVRQDPATVNPSLFGLELYAPNGGSRIAFGFIDAFGNAKLAVGGQTLTSALRARREDWNRLVIRLDWRTRTVRMSLNGLDAGIEGPLTATAVGEVDLRASALGFDAGWFDDLRVARSTWRAPLRGQIRLADWTGAIAGVAVAVRLTPEAGGAPVERTATLDAQGRFEVESPLSGRVRVRVKAPTWLAESRSLEVGPAGATFVETTLRNGDVDGDDAVTVFDFDLLSTAFDTAAGDPGWDVRADLDGDGAVSVFDYDILSRNFDQEGT